MCTVGKAVGSAQKIASNRLSNVYYSYFFPSISELGKVKQKQGTHNVYKQQSFSNCQLNSIKINHS